MGWLSYVVNVLTLGGIYAALALILNVEAGWAGLWDLGMAGLLAVGSYFYIITTVAPGAYADTMFHPGWPMLLGIVGSALFTAAVAFVIGTPALRLRGEYFLITTFAFAEVIRQVMTNESELTRGTIGFSEVRRPFAGSVHGSDYRWVLLAIVAALLAAVWAITRRLGRAPTGRLLRAIRDNEPVARSLGKDVTRYRIQTFVLSGAMIGAVAPVYIWYIRSVVPQLFTIDVTFTAWTALVIGGVGSFTGPLLGAFALVALTEGVQLLQVDPEHATQLAAARPFILGVVLILLMRFRPEGLVTERFAFRAASRRFGPRRRPDAERDRPTAAHVAG